MEQGGKQDFYHFFPSLTWNYVSILHNLKFYLKYLKLLNMLKQQLSVYILNYTELYYNRISVYILANRQWAICSVVIMYKFPMCTCKIFLFCIRNLKLLKKKTKPIHVKSFLASRIILFLHVRFILLKH